MGFLNSCSTRLNCYQKIITEAKTRKNKRKIAFNEHYKYEVSPAAIFWLGLIIYVYN